MYTEILNVGL